MAREDFGTRRGIDEVKDDSPTASIVGIAIPALVIVAAVSAYFLIPRTDEKFNQVQTAPPATTQQAPKMNSEPVQSSPDADIKKAPPAAEPKSDSQPRDPRSDSQNSN